MPALFIYPIKYIYYLLVELPKNYSLKYSVSFLFYSLLVFNSINSVAQDTISIFFPLDVAEVNIKSIRKIDSGIYHNILSNSETILIIGYADYLGTNSYNEVLSQKRANNVRDYLVSMAISKSNIITCVGKGEISRAIERPKGYQADRRVDIISLKNISGNDAITPNNTIIDNKPQPSPTLPPKAVIVPISFKEITGIEQLRVGQLLVLDRIFFHTGRHKVVDQSLAELDKLYLLLERNPDTKIRIEGHVCCVHPSVDALDIDTGEIALSVNRAKSIYNYLIKKGISEKRLSYKGFGKSRPLRPREYTDEDRNMNKRVEVRILDK